MSVLGLSAAFFSFVVPRLSDRFGRRPVVVGFNLLGVLVPLAALYADGSLYLLGALIFLGWSASGTFPLFMGTIPSETIPARYVATSLGLMVGIGEIVGGVGGAGHRRLGRRSLRPHRTDRSSRPASPSPAPCWRWH